MIYPNISCILYFLPNILSNFVSWQNQQKLVCNCKKYVCMGEMPHIPVCFLTFYPPRDVPQFIVVSQSIIALRFFILLSLLRTKKNRFPAARVNQIFPMRLTSNIAFFLVGLTTNYTWLYYEVCFIRNSFIRNEDIKNSKALVTSEDRSFIHLHIIKRRKCPKCSKCSEIIKPS